MERNQDIEQIVVVDIFDIDVVISQFETILQLTREAGMDPSTDWKKAVEVLREIKNNPKIVYRAAYVGKDSLSDLYGSADFVINVAGPKSINTIQQSLLKDSNSRVVTSYSSS